MRLIDLVLNNLRRRKGRILLVVVGLAIGVGTVVSLNLIVSSIEREVGSELDQYGANIVVVPRANTQEVAYGSFTVSAATFDLRRLKEQDVAKIKSIQYANRLSTVAPELLASTKIDDQEILVAGVLFDQELRIKKWWRVSGRIPDREDELLLGSDVARRLGAVEDRAEVAGASAHGSHMVETASRDTRLLRDELPIGASRFKVAGVLEETGGQDDQIVYLPLAAAERALARPGEISLVEVSALCNGCPIDDIVAQIQAALPEARVSAVQQAVKARIQTAGQLSRFRAVISMVIVFTSSLVIFVTMMGSVVERTREIGVLRALGYRRSHVVRIFLIEAALISLAGGLLGWGLGTVFGTAIEKQYVESAGGLHLSISFGVIAIVAAVVVGTLSSLYPAVKASQLDPMESVRYF
jgi:putative ABC transport system permease protein